MTSAGKKSFIPPASNEAALAYTYTAFHEDSTGEKIEVGIIGQIRKSSLK